MIELKCEKCKRVLIARCATYQELIKKAQKGKVTVQLLIKIELRPTYKGGTDYEVL